MKLTAKYNLKNIWNKAKGKIDKYGKFVMVGIALSTVVACEKPDPAPEPTPVTPTPVTPTTQKHNVELRYGVVSSTDWENISLDTIRKYNADPTVDTIFMVPEAYDQFSTATVSGMQNRVVKLRERHNVNPAKVFGKGELKLAHLVVDDAPEVVRFLEDTLKYRVVYDTKSR